MNNIKQTQNINPMNKEFNNIYRVDTHQVKRNEKLLNRNLFNFNKFPNNTFLNNTTDIENELRGTHKKYNKFRI